MQLLTGVGERPTRIAFSPDGRHLAVGDAQAFRLWDLTAGPEPVWIYPDSNFARNFCFAPSGLEIIGGGRDQFARYNMHSGQVVRDPQLCNFRPERLSPSGHLGLAVENHSNKKAVKKMTLRLTCAAVGLGGYSEMWRKDIPFDPEHNDTGYRILRFVRVAMVGPASFQNTAKTVVEIYDATSGELIAPWTGELPCPLWTGAVSLTGAVVVLNNKTFYAVDTSDTRTKPVKRENVSSKHFTSTAFSHDGRWLATTSNDTAATIWATSTWEILKRYEWQIGRLRTVAFSSDGLRCAAASEMTRESEAEGQIVVWDLDD
jgi:WD40 repeat protein